jgi:connector enhancer of kinase suppressor of Ras 2
MLLQPSYLDLVTLKKKESELGFYIMPSYQFIHRVTDVKYNSPAHNSGKVEDGDEIVQINYQTVVGWQYKKVLLQLQDLSSTDVILTLKKRPKHTKIYGQLMGLIKLPSKKRSLPYRFDNLPSPRVELINVPDLLIPAATKPIAIKNEIEIEETDDSSGNESDLMTPTEIKSVEKEHRLYLPKPRAVLQRRHTICGDDLVNFKHIGNLVLWHERKHHKENLDSPSLRDKSISVSFYWIKSFNFI